MLQALREETEKRIQDLEKELVDLRKQKQALQQKNVLLEMGKSTLSLTAIHKQLEVSAQLPLLLYTLRPEGGT